LAAVQKKFGGQSAEFAQTAAGQMQGLQNEISDVVEEIGFALLPMFKEAVKAISAFLRAFTEGGGLAGVADAFKNAVSIFSEVFGVITGSAPDAGAALTKALGPDAAKMIMQVFATIRDVVKAVLSGDVPAIFNALLKFVGDSVPKITEALLRWGREFFAWIGPQIQPMLQEFLGLLSSALQWLGDHAEEIGQTLVSWGLKFGEFIVTTAIPALIEHLPGILLTIGEWVITKGIPGVIGFFFKLGKGMISGLLDALGSLKDELVKAIGDAFAAIDFWVGPFHITGHGIEIVLPTITMPSFGGGASSGPPPGTGGGGYYGPEVVPGFQHGGIMPHTGLAFVHAGERIMPPDQNRAGNWGGTTINIYADVIDAQAVDRLADRIGGRFTMQRKLAGW